MLLPVDETFRRALAALRAGDTKGAERLFKDVLAVNQRHIASLNLLGAILHQMGRSAEAEGYLQQALREDTKSDTTLYNYGLVLRALRRPAEAVQRFTEALAINPNVAETWNNRGVAFNDLKCFKEAVADFDKAIAINANYVQAYCNKGNSLARLRRADEALEAYRKALELDPKLGEAWLGYGTVLADRKLFDDANAAFDKALAFDPKLGLVWDNRGKILAKLKRYDEASAAFDKALALQPDLSSPWFNRGVLLFELKQIDAASAAFDNALALDPNSALAWIGRGTIFSTLRQSEAAKFAYEKALELEPELAAGWLALGNLHYQLKHHNDALAAFDKALALEPDLVEAWYGRGNVFSDLRQYDQALADYDRAFALRASLDFLMGARLHAKQQICDWTGLEAEASRFVSAVRNEELAGIPFSLLPLSASPDDHLRCAVRNAAAQPSFPKLWRGEVYNHERIRVAYLSSDFGIHPVATQIVGLFEHHDKTRFEITAISTGPDDQSDLRSRIKVSSESFVDAALKSDQDIAELIYRAQIDIVVDLNGLTAGGRGSILARRPAPIQVSYLGYAGTMGSKHFDYIIADRIVVPEQHFPFFTENVVWLPDSFFATDSRREIAERTPSRGECGLPERAIVFCCFNNTYKIAPDVFHLWMRLLKAVEDSVLWLTEASAVAKDNLFRQAEQTGISSKRLVFAPRKPRAAEHLARLRQADLFLDTLPYNAHSTAADALWVGLPVLTCLGTAFPGRVAASMLKAVGLPELITSSLQEYENLALRLARDPAALGVARASLARNRTVHPLFDTERLARHIEAAYTVMRNCYRAGENPQPIVVKPIDTKH